MSSVIGESENEEGRQEEEPCARLSSRASGALARKRRLFFYRDERHALA